METYEEILSRMTEKYKELCGNVPHESSDIAVRMKVLAGEIYSTLVNIQWLKRQMFADTAQGEYLDLHAKSRGLSRREASFAVGEVEFSVAEPAQTDLSIPAGTVLSTTGEDPLYFETTEAITIHKGNKSNFAEVVAMSEGRAYNVAANAVKVVVTPIAGVHNVKNYDPFVNGGDAESDENLRARIIDSFKNASNGTNCAYYKNLAMQYPGVGGAGVVPRGRGAGTVDVYICGEGAEVSDELVAQVQKLLSECREVNVDVLVKKAESVYADFYLRLDVEDGYEFDEVKDQCLVALHEYIASRGVGSNLLLVEAGECIYHIEGVKEYAFTPALNCDFRLEPHQYPVAGFINITQGVV